jgi:uncharacterized membrane protein YkvA (DUF1232 family)
MAGKSKKKTSGGKSAPKTPRATGKPRKAKDSGEENPGPARAITKQQAAETLRRDAEKVTPDDVEKVLEQTEELEKRFQSGGPLGKFLDDFRLLLSIVKDYWSGRYRKIPYWTVAAIVAALLYVLNPFDLVPDFIPVVGQLDDALVVGACLALIGQDLHRYRQWKDQNPD